MGKSTSNSGKWAVRVHPSRTEAGFRDLYETQAEAEEVALDLVVYYRRMAEKGFGEERKVTVKEVA